MPCQVARAGRLIAVTRLAFEARIAAGPGVRVLCGDDLEGLRSAAEAGAKGIISFGVAGGLVPDLAAGDWVVGANVVTAEGRYPTDRLWSERLLRALPGAAYADVFGADHPVADENAKRRLHLATGTAAVDTESHIVATVASAHCIPFAVCRVVVDGLQTPLPPAVSAAMWHHGTIDLFTLLRSLFRQPIQALALARLIWDTHVARRALSRGRQLLGDELSFPAATSSAPIASNNASKGSVELI